MKILRVLFRVILFAALTILVLAIAIVVHGYALTEWKQNRPVVALSVSPDSALVQRGKHLAEIACAGCHSPNESLPLSGSAENFLADSSGPSMGTLYVPNLTPGGVLRKASDGQLARAIREGIGVDGRPLVIMPSAGYRDLSDRDLRALIAFLRSQPAITHETPPRRFGFLPYFLVGTHLFPTSVQPRPAPAVADIIPGANPDYGHYLVRYIGCNECHGAELRGRKPGGPGPPAGPDIVMVAQQHPPEVFDRALRHGISPTGLPLNPSMMPWNVFARLTNLEAEAIYLYVKNLPAVH